MQVVYSVCLAALFTGWAGVVAHWYHRVVYSVILTGYVLTTSEVLSAQEWRIPPLLLVTQQNNKVNTAEYCCDTYAWHSCAVQQIGALRASALNKAQSSSASLLVELVTKWKAQVCQYVIYTTNIKCKASRHMFKLNNGNLNMTRKTIKIPESNTVSSARTC